MLCHAAGHEGYGRVVYSKRDAQKAASQADPPAEGGPATPCRGTLDERSRQRALNYCENRSLPQIHNDGTASNQVQRRTCPLRGEKLYCGFVTCANPGQERG